MLDVLKKAWRVVVFVVLCSAIVGCLGLAKLTQIATTPVVEAR